jgi:hypothetical protein
MSPNDKASDAAAPKTYDFYWQTRIDEIVDRVAQAHAEGRAAASAIATHERECSERYARLLVNIKWLTYAVVASALLTVLGGPEAAQMILHYAGLK